MVQVAGVTSVVLILLLLSASAEPSIKPRQAPVLSTQTQISFPLQHAFGLTNDFVDAGTFTARANTHPVTGAVRLSHVKLSRNAFTEDDAAAFSTCGFYRVRVPADALHPDGSTFVSTFLPATCLLASSLAENYVLHTDERGHVLALELAPPGGACAPTGSAPSTPTPFVFTSKAAVRLPKDVPRLSSRAYVVPEAGETASNEAEPEAAADLQPPVAEKTFFQRYGLVIVVLIANVAMRGMFQNPAPARSADEAEGPARVTAE